MSYHHFSTFERGCIEELLTLGYNMKKKKYDIAFKREAIRVVEEQGEKAAIVVRDIHVAA